MTRLTVTADIPAATDLLGKVVSDLQSDVSVNSSSITGTLKYVDDYTGFSGDTEEQVGNYLALYCECEAADTITVELIGGTHGPVDLDEDGLIVLRIRNTSQRVKVTATADGESYSKTYNLLGMTLEAES